jgi:hypothetical protein
MTQFIQGPTGAFGVDDVYITLNPPGAVFLPGKTLYNGAASGVASWGPFNSPLNASSPDQLIAQWGFPLNSGKDLVQEGALFLRQFPQGGFYGIRVGDGTQAAATATLKDTAVATGLTLTAYYMGTYGNLIQCVLTAGSNSAVGALTYKLTITAPGRIPEVFDRIPTGGTAAVTWQNIANAVNNGLGVSTPASKFCTAAVASSTALPALGTVTTLTGGVDGATTITTTIQQGTDGSAGARTGLYAVRGYQVDAVWMCGNTDSTGWANLLAFAKSIQALAFGSFPVATGISAAVTAKLTAGTDDPWIVLLKDFVYYNDSYVNAVVSVPPACVAAGIACRMGAYLSPGNKPAYGIFATESTYGPNPQNYSTGDLTTLEAAGINVITNPIPGANTFGLRHGKNSSSNFATSEIAYTRKTNELLRDFGSGTVAGQFVGQVQTTAPDDPVRLAVAGAFRAYLGPQVGNEIVAYTVTCDLTNNTPARIRQGFLRVDVVVQYLSVVDKFYINLTAGQTVSVLAQSQLPQAA